MNRRNLITTAVAALVGLTRRQAAAQSVQAIVYEAASRHGVSGDWLWSVALCESNGNPGAISARPNINGTMDCGLFQINALTWEWWAEERGRGGDIWNAYDNADMAAWAWSRGYACHWTCAYVVGWCE